MAQFLYRIQPVNPHLLASGPTPGEEEVIADHFEYLVRLSHEGVVLLAGRTLNTDRSGMGIVIFEAGSEEEARTIMLDDPAVQQGVFSSELFPFRIAITSMTRKEC